jgi:hypothetical protein
MDRRQDPDRNRNKRPQQQAHNGQLRRHGIAALEFLNDRLAGPVGVPEVEPHRPPEPLPILHEQGLVKPEVLPDLLQGLLVDITTFARAQNVERHVSWEQPHEQKNQCHGP